VKKRLPGLLTAAGMNRQLLGTIETADEEIEQDLNSMACGITTIHMSKGLLNVLHCVWEAWDAI
jgi:hypothetical protein